jgi:DNA adenine methylase
MNTTPNPIRQTILSKRHPALPRPKVKDVLDNHLRIPKPILKWVGGKTQILNKIMPEFPVEMDNYVEPFWAARSCFLFNLC